MELLTGDQSALYTGFLNIKGRLITDAIITRPKIYKTNSTVDYKDNEFWIDVNREMTKRLTDHLRRYMWKKKAELSEIDSKEAQVYAAYVKMY
jgi:folate-binding Fe-S cluster repair protein YgfZ